MMDSAAHESGNGMADALVLAPGACARWSEGEVGISVPGLGPEVLSEDLALLALVHAFARPRSVDAVLPEFPEADPGQIREVLDELLRAGVLVVAPATDGSCSAGSTAALPRAGRKDERAKKLRTAEGKRVGVGVVGLRFGAKFVPLYQGHPESECVAVCSRSKEQAAIVARAYGVTRVFTQYEDLLRCPGIDAIHVVAPVALHASMCRAALDAGKHVACAVPMATSVAECKELVTATRRAGRVYMMMETAVFTRHFMFARELAQTGAFGEIQFLRGCHHQDMSQAGHAAYWRGFPPMLYATHATAPLLALVEREVASVVCFGSGRVREEYASIHGCPFAVETALLRLQESEVVCEVTRSVTDTARQYREGFDVYGSKMSLEWEQLHGGGAVHYSGSSARRVDPAEYDQSLPAPMASARTIGKPYVDHVDAALPHLVDEFVSAIVEEREPTVGAVRSAHWTIVGICAHESAMQGGVTVAVPKVV